jgi:uncharacterized Tic20 family protein
MTKEQNFRRPQKQALNIPVVSGRFLLRILLFPFIFLWGIFMLAAGTLFPLPLLVIISFYGLLLEPFIWLLRKSGSKINGIEPFIDDTGNNALGHFLGLTIYVWGAFAIVYVYLKDGTVWTGE